MAVNKPKEIAGMYLLTITLALVGGFLLFIAASARSSYRPEIGGLDYIAWIVMLASAVLGMIATWRMAAAIDWLVARRHAEVAAHSDH